jgi:hypothetical protein
MKKLASVLVLVLILLATALPAFAGGDQNHGNTGQGNVCRYGSPNVIDPSCPPVP